LIYYCEKASDFTTSYPSPREVVVQLLMMKSSHIKIKIRETERPARRSARDEKLLLVAMTKIKTYEMGTPRSS
jgi:hypothetical protein